MKSGNPKILIYLFSLLLFNFSSTFALNEIKSVPLINLKELSPTFEEDKDELEKLEKNNTITNTNENFIEKSELKKSDKIYVNLKALDKITAKT